MSSDNVPTEEVVFPETQSIDKLVFDDLATHIVVVNGEPMCYVNSLDRAIQTAEVFAKDLVKEHTDSDGKWHEYAYRKSEDGKTVHVTRRDLGYLYNGSFYDFILISVQTISHARIETTVVKIEKSE